MAPRNLVNLESVTKAYGHDPVLAAVSLGIGEGERIGVVGRNGGGKSTLLAVLTGHEAPDSGRVTHAGGLRLGALSQSAAADPGRTIRDLVVGDRAEHEWAADRRTREILTELLGGFAAEQLDRDLATLSGGERRRAELAALLLQELDLLVLDEPTNHLDVEAVAWLAAHLNARRSLSVVVVTHDRWFLDEVSLRTWEVVAGSVEEYDGGYSAFVLAKAERARQADAEQARRNNLIRKELAWLRRGAPARTSKPKFRVDAANELIRTEPPPRDSAELLAFAGARLGKTVLECHDLDVAAGGRTLLSRLTWNVGPGERIGIVGVNGAGKTSLVRTLLGEQRPAAGRLVTGSTVKPAFLSQHLAELDGGRRVLEAVEDVARRVEIGKGRELSASQLCERLGFGPDAQWTPVADLSGGEKRRLQLTRLLMGGPNLLVLDEPTNDFDTETLAALEDLLDSFAGTLLVISHDRYFLERVCDRFVGLLGDRRLRDLPGGVEEYLRLRHAQVESGMTAGAPQPPKESASSAAGLRAARKEMARWENTLSKLDRAEAELHDELAAHAADHLRVSALDEQLRALHQQRSAAEEAWLAAAELVEGG